MVPVSIGLRMWLAALVLLEHSSGAGAPGAPACHRPVYSWWDSDRPPLNITANAAGAVAKGVSDIVMLGWVSDRNGTMRFAAAPGQSKVELTRQRIRL